MAGAVLPEDRAYFVNCSVTDGTGRRLIEEGGVPVTSEMTVKGESRRRALCRRVPKGIPQASMAQCRQTLESHCL